MAAPKINSDFFDGFSDEEEEEEKEVVENEEEEEIVQEEEEEKEEELDSKDKSKEEKEEESDTKEEEEEGSDEEFFTAIINDGAEKGLFYYDPEKEYEGDPEDIFWEVQKDTLDKRFEEEYVNAIPEDYRSLLTHLKLGKPLDEWVEAIKPIDYSKVDIEDEANQKSLIEEHLLLMGMDEDDIKDTLQEYEDAGTLDKNSKKALKYLQKNEDKKAEIYETQLEEEVKQAEKRQKEDFDKFKSEVLSTEELGKIKLSKKERENLLDHITKGVNKKGESQYVINQKSREKQLQMAYLDMIGFDFSKIEKEATTKAVSGLRAKLSKTTDINAKKLGSTGRTSTDSNKIPDGFPWG